MWNLEEIASSHTQGDYLRWGDWAVPRRVGALLEADGKELQGTLRASFEMRNGVPECTSLVIELKEGKRPVRQSDLEMLPELAPPLGRIAVRALLQGARRYDDEKQAVRPPGADTACEAQMAEAVLSARLGHGRELDEAERLLEVARVFLSHDETPLRAVENRFHVSTPTASRWVNKARQAGLVPPKRSPRHVRRQARERLEALLKPLEQAGPPYRLADAVDDVTADTFRALLRTEGREAAYAYLWKAIDQNTEEGKTVGMLWGDTLQAYLEDLKARREEEGGAEHA